MEVNVGPSGVRALPLAVAAERSVHCIWYYFGPSGVRALPLAAGINEGGHYFRYIILCSYRRYSKPQKGLSYCFKFLHGLLNKNNKNYGKKKNRTLPPYPLHYDTCL